MRQISPSVCLTFCSTPQGEGRVLLIYLHSSIALFLPLVPLCTIPNPVGFLVLHLAHILLVCPFVPPLSPYTHFFMTIAHANMYIQVQIPGLSVYLAFLFPVTCSCA